MAGKRRKPNVLVVDDEPDLVDLYATNLEGEYGVSTAYGGTEAIELIEDGAEFDVALIDRRMPSVSGDEVLDRLNETSPGCRVAMVTAVEPDFDVIDMPFDEYLVKPIRRAEIQDTVERLLRLEDYRERRQEGYALASKVAALKAHKDPEELEDNEEYEELVGRLEEIRDELDDTAQSFDSSDFAAAYSDIEAGDVRITTTD
ncbi:MAG TPA: HalX domain-containing protein [Halobacteriales archaeon]|nr:HalX domain-containing protein [Halobacteriales archaeon]